LQACHLERLAIVYVRQSSPQQVLKHKESTALQYALVDLAVELGWPSEQIIVIDEDQAKSASTAEGRLGFQRLLAEVSLDHVGIVLGIQMSRLARSNKDWHQLLEVCAIFRTLLADQDGLYDPTDYNDRLVLGLKGTMSEAEIHILRGRMHETKLNKARRGDLFMIPPIGYVKLPRGEFAMDPDEQVQSVVRLIFDQFDRQGTIRGVLRYMVQHGIKMPVRPHAGPNRGNLEWRQPTRSSVAGVLTHEIYAGIYRYGHRQVDPRRKKPGKPGSGRVLMDPQNYHALVPDRCPAYINVARYEANQRRLIQNRVHGETKGPPRDGQSLLGGLLKCGRCDRPMGVHYSGKDKHLRYKCYEAERDYKGPPCQSLSGQVLDELVRDKVMAALEPAALELSLAAANDLEQERDRLEQNWRQRRERAAYESQRAERQYRAVEPENRLVARELERGWEEALKEQQQLEQEYARFQQTQPTKLAAAERKAIMSLARNIPALWNAPTTSFVDRQRIVRQLLDQVVVKVQGKSEHVDVTLHWAGGFTSQHELVRPVLRYEQLADFDGLIALIEQLRAEGKSFAAIADRLNQEGFRPVKRAARFHGDLVKRLLRRVDQRRGKWTPGRKIPSEPLARHEWLVIDLAKEIGVPKSTLHSWIKRGWVRLQRQLPGYRGQLISWADAHEVARLRKLRDTPHGWWDPPLPTELTTPNPAGTCD
jgi:DNA invertase Pin-like site-specific DNA recombinase